MSISLRTYNEPGRLKIFWNKIAKFKYIYLMLIPVIAYYTIFQYIPMYGACIAFQNFTPSLGFASPWVGFRHFVEFFNSYYFWRLIRNTLSINLLDIIFGFPAPIILALLLNEINQQFYKRSIQTITYMPHFVSQVVVVGLIIDFCSSNGLINSLIVQGGGQPLKFLTHPLFFQPLYVASGIWQNVGWGSIIYLAALAGVDPQLYDSAKVDGAGRFKQLIYITLPSIAPTIIIMLILRVGRMMTVGFEKVMLMYNPLVYDTADVISTFVYRKGLLDMSFSYAAAVGLFNSALNFILLIMMNSLSRRVSKISLW